MSNNISIVGHVLDVWAAKNQIRDCITVDTIQYVAMYIPDSLNFDTVSYLVYITQNRSVPFSNSPMA